MFDPLVYAATNPSLIILRWWTDKPLYRTYRDLYYTAVICLIPGTYIQVVNTVNSKQKLMKTLIYLLSKLNSPLSYKLSYSSTMMEYLPFTLLVITQSVIWNFKVNVKTNRNCSLECKVSNSNFQNIQHSLPCKTRNKMYSALLLRYTWNT
jgi:hypothetical protein